MPNILYLDDNGVSVLKTLIGEPTDEQVTTAVNAALAAHPEWTTTVQDGSITGPKIADDTIPDAKLAQTGGVLSEVHDIRTGADGTIYASAGNAVRGQISDLNSAINDTNAEIGRFNVAVDSVGTDQYYNASGEVVLNSSWKTVIFAVAGISTIVYSGLTNVGAVPHSIWLNSSKEYISDSAFKQKTGENHLSVLSGAAYVGFSVNNTDNANFRVIGITDDGLVEEISALSALLYENGKTYDRKITGWNDIGNDYTNEYIKADGTRARSSYLRTSRYIMVNHGDTVSASGMNLNIGGETIFGIACYDVSKVFVPDTGLTGSTNNVSGSFVVPEGVAYIAISDGVASEPTFDIAEYTFNFGNQITKNTKRIEELTLYGKKICNFGDSVFGQARPPYDVSTRLAELTGAVVYNCGFGGCQMGVHSNANFDAFSMYRLADAIASGDWTLQETAAQASEVPAYFAETVTLLQSLDFADIDIITIAYGTNDFANGLQPVTSNNSDSGNNKFKAVGTALQYSIDKILSAYSNLRIFICVPTYRVWLTSDNQFSEDSNTKVITAWVGGPEQDHTLLDFVAAENNVAKANQLPVIDNYYNLGINRYDWAEYFPSTDGTHHNQTGRNLIAEHMAHCLW